MWISDCLTGRKQRVVLKEKYSDWAPVVSAVAQGSSDLGPILCILYINSMGDETEKPILFYADDAKV